MLVPITSEVAAFAWADQLYRETVPFPANEYGHTPEDALLAYRQVERRFGRSDRAATRIGDLLVALGHYREASAAYPASARAKRGVARQRQAWSDASCPYAKERAVVMVEPVPRQRGRWVVLFARIVKTADTSDEAWAPPESTRVGVRLMGPKGPLGREIRVDGEAARHASLYVTDLARGRLPVAIVHREFWAADCDPNEQAFFRIDGGRLRPIRRFEGLAPVRIAPADARRGLRIASTATWKVWWPDVYEWDGRRFAFANRRSPELYPLVPRPYGVRGYPVWLHRASAFAIHGRSGDALAALRRAEAACQALLRLGTNASESEYYTAGFHGDDRENLREIRRRIRWLQRGDDRPLLYRPYDWDLQVPPYRLGRSKTLQEKRGGC